MTKKRFVETLSTGIVTDTITRKEYLCEMRIDDELLELLNELDKENQDLATKKEDAEYELLHLKEKYEQLLEENEQLKFFVEYEKRQHKHWKRECFENIKEIAQLKREIVQLKGDVE